MKASVARRALAARRASATQRATMLGLGRVKCTESMRAEWKQAAAATAAAAAAAAAASAAREASGVGRARWDVGPT